MISPLPLLQVRGQLNPSGSHKSSHRPGAQACTCWVLTPAYCPICPSSVPSPMFLQPSVLDEHPALAGYQLGWVLLSSVRHEASKSWYWNRGSWIEIWGSWGRREKLDFFPFLENVMIQCTTNGFHRISLRMWCWGLNSGTCVCWTSPYLSELYISWA